MAYLYQTIRAAEQAMVRRFAKATGGEVTLPQLVLLDALGDERRTSSVIVWATGIDRSTASVVLRSMAKRGWIRTQRDKEDRRAVVHELTTKGRKVLGLGRAALRVIEDDLRRQSGSQAVERALRAFSAESKEGDAPVRKVRLASPRATAPAE